MHDFLRQAFEVSQESALQWCFENYPEHLDALELVPFERLPPPMPDVYTPEVSLAYHLKTGKVRLLGRGLNRNEARALAAEDEVPMTLDLTALETGGSVLVIDWKTGFKLVDPVQINWQVKTYAVAAARFLGMKKARVAIIRVLWNGTVPPWEFIELDEWALEAHEAAMRQLYKRRARVLAIAAGEIEGELPPPVVGPHCDYCPALRSCPAMMNLVRATANVEAVRDLAPAELARAWRELEAREKALKLVRAWFMAAARQEPIVLENGDILGEKLVTTETLVPDRAEAALSELFSPEVARVLVSESTETLTKLTKKSFKAALKRYALPTLPEQARKITWVERDAYAKLRERRGVSVKTSKQVKVYRPGKAAANTADEIPDDEEAA